MSTNEKSSNARNDIFLLSLGGLVTLAVGLIFGISTVAQVGGLLLTLAFFTLLHAALHAVLDIRDHSEKMVDELQQLRVQLHRANQPAVPSAPKPAPTPLQRHLQSAAAAQIECPECTSTFPAPTTGDRATCPTCRAVLDIV